MQLKSTKNKVVVTTNLDTATPEQKERLMNNVVKAYQILYRSVLDRHARSLGFVLTDSS